VTPDEYCDDGGTDANNQCNNDCTGDAPGWTCTGGDFDPKDASDCIETCNDGIITTNEDCDDGNTNNGDGCSDACVTEAGWDCDCATIPCTCSGICGDGMMKTGEVCDDGNTSDDDHCLGDCSGPVDGWYCSGGSASTPVDCNTQCNDGHLVGTE